MWGGARCSGRPGCGLRVLVASGRGGKAHAAWQGSGGPESGRTAPVAWRGPDLAPMRPAHRPRGLTVLTMQVFRDLAGVGWRGGGDQPGAALQ